MDIKQILANVRGTVQGNINLHASNIKQCADIHGWSLAVVRDQSIRSMQEVHKQVSGTMILLHAMHSGMDSVEFEAIRGDLRTLMNEVHEMTLQIINNQADINKFVKEFA